MVHFESYHQIYDLCQFMNAHDDHDYASTPSFRLWWCDVPESPGPFSHEVHDHGFRAVHVLRRARQENDPGNVRQMNDQHLGAIRSQSSKKSIGKLGI